MELVNGDQVADQTGCVPTTGWVIEKPLAISLLVISCVRFLPICLMMFDQSSVQLKSIILHGKLDVFQFLGLIRALHLVFKQPGCNGALVSALSFALGFHLQHESQTTCPKCVPVYVCLNHELPVPPKNNNNNNPL